MHPKELLGALALSTTLMSGAAAANSITVEALAREPAIRSVSMSAEGDLVAAIIAMPGSDYRKTALATWDLNNLDKGPVITPSGDKMKFIATNALKSGKVIVAARQEWTGSLAGCGEGNVRGSTATFVTKTYLTDAKHDSFEPAFEETGFMAGMSDQMKQCLEIAGTASLVDLLPMDPEKVIIRQLDRTDLRADYYMYDMKTGRTKLFVRGGDDTEPDLFHPVDGQLIVRTELEPKDGDYEQRFWMRDEVDAEFEYHPELTTMLGDRYTMNVVGVNDDTGEYYVLTDRFSDHVQARSYNPTTRQFSRDPVVAHPEFDIAALVFDQRRESFNEVVGFVVAGPTYETTLVDPEMASIHEGLKKAFPGQNVRLIGYNDDLSRVLFSASNAQNPPSFHLLTDKKNLKPLGNSRPWIDPEDIGKQRWVTYTARDGMKIPAILDLPAGWTREDGPLPAIVHPHGGPWSRDTMGWDVSGWVPYLTSRGFAVLRPQYRGSTGLGRDLWIAGDAQWGLKMQDDKDDGALWMVEEGIADKDRIAIFGYSYGGFAAAAATVRPNGPFRCAISGAPVTDLTRLGNRWSESRLQRRLQGRTVTGMDPMENTDKADIPVLLFVGSRDVRTPKWHAENFYEAVKDKVPARYELIPDMPHSLPWYPRHFESMFSLMGDFLENECQFGSVQLASN